MANVNSYGSLTGSSGAVIPLENDAMTEGTLEEILTSNNFVGSQQSAGTYGDQLSGGFVLTAGAVCSLNDIAYAFVRSAGTIKAALPVGDNASGNNGFPAPLPYAKRLSAGDQVMVMANGTSDRECALAVACSSGEYHVFSVTPTGGAENELVSVLTGNSIGQTLQGRVITHMFAVSGANQTQMTSPAYILNGSGVPTGSVFPTDVAVSPAAFQGGYRVPVELNARAVIRTDA